MRRIHPVMTVVSHFPPLCELDHASRSLFSLSSYHDHKILHSRFECELDAASRDFPGAKGAIVVTDLQHQPARRRERVDADLGVIGRKACIH